VSVPRHGPGSLPGRCRGAVRLGPGATGAAGGPSQPGARRGAREPVLNGGGDARRLSRLGHHAAQRRFGSVTLGNAALSKDGRHVGLPRIRSTTIRPTRSRSDCPPLQGPGGAGHRARGATRRGARPRPAGCAPVRGTDEGHELADGHRYPRVDSEAAVKSGRSVQRLRQARRVPDPFLDHIQEPGGKIQGIACL